jgi:hypothetical protein
VDTEEQPTTPIDWDKPIETTEGLPARLLSSDYRFEGVTFMLVQIEYHHRSTTRVFRKNGTPYWPSEGCIRNRKTKREGWINIFRDQWVGLLHESEEAARGHPSAESAIATIKIEWEE